jgi:hypothetical protein
MANSRQTKILILKCNPHSTTPLDLQKESDAIESIANEAKGHHLTVHIIEGCQWDDIKTNIANYDPDIIHFSGHGTDAANLIFESTLATGASERIGLARVHEALRPALTGKPFRERPLRAVILNACFSASDEEACKTLSRAAGAPVIGWGLPVADQLAIDFSKSFYSSLAETNDVQRAFKKAEKSIASSGGEQKPQFWHHDPSCRVYVFPSV